MGQFLLASPPNRGEHLIAKVKGDRMSKTLFVVAGLSILLCSAACKSNAPDNKNTSPTPADEAAKPQVNAPSPQTAANQIDPNSRYKSPVRQTSGILFLTPGSSLHIDAEGSPGGKMELAGLTFRENCRLTVGNDYTLFADKEGIVGTDSKKKKWVSKKFQLEDKEMIAFFPS